MNMTENNTDEMKNHNHHEEKHEAHSMKEGHGVAFNNDLNFTVLYRGWEVASQESLAWTCVVIAMLTITFEALKVVRGHIFITQSKAQLWGYTEKLLNKWHFVDTLCYLLQVFLAYHIMLAVMTFNSWIFVSVMLSFTIGHLFLAPLAKPTELETCCT